LGPIIAPFLYDNIKMDPAWDRAWN